MCCVGVYSVFGVYGVVCVLPYNGTMYSVCVVCCMGAYDVFGVCMCVVCIHYMCGGCWLPYKGTTLCVVYVRCMCVVYVVC